MVRLTTYPSRDILEEQSAATPDFMRPNKIPFAVVAEGYLSDEICDEIRTELMVEEPYTVGHCNAITREIIDNPLMDPIEDAGRYLNWMYWEYDLDPVKVSWMQTYETDMDYQLHMDGSPGQMRKLTAVAFLSHPDEYEGGDLVILHHPMKYTMPRARGTIVVFQPWVLHEVTRVTRGLRQTINMGFYGPPFK